MGELQDLGLLLWCIISQLQLPTIKTRLPDASCEGEGGAGQGRGAVQCAKQLTFVLAGDCAL